MKNQLYHVPDVLECDGIELFEGDQVVSIADRDFDPNYWISLRYVSRCQKVFNLEVTTFKDSLGEEFFEEFEELVKKHTNKML